MEGIFSKHYYKFFAKRWTIGLGTCNIKDVLRTKTFDPEIHWLPKKSLNKFEADPFILRTANGGLELLYEEFSLKDDYGKILVADLDRNFRTTSKKTLIDTGDHLSYPFVINEDGNTYVIPESSHAGRVSCYSYDPGQKSATFIKDLINLSLLDSTVLKFDGKYWIFGIVKVNENNYELMIFYSKDLLGPFTGHPLNPIKKGLDGTRPAGNFIQIDGGLFRPAQNCRNTYGESITIFKINQLNEFEFKEEIYMNVNIRSHNPKNRGIHSIHTLNVLDDLFVIDGQRWIFAPIYRLKSNLKRNVNFK